MTYAMISIVGRLGLETAAVGDDIRRAGDSMPRLYLLDGKGRSSGQALEETPTATGDD